MGKKLPGTVYIAFGAILWSTGGVLIKLVSADPVLIAAIRAVIAGLALAPFIRPIKLSWQLPALIFFYGALSTSFVVSTKLTAAANAIALQSTAPLWIFLATLVVYRKVNWHQALPVGLIALGLGAFLCEPAVGTSAMGNLVAIGSGIFFAVNTKLLQKLGRENSIGLISICNLGAAPLIWLLVPEGAKIADVNFTGWVVLVILGVFQLGIAYVLYTIGLRTTTPQKATMVALLEPAFNPIWVLLFLGEIPTVYGIVGGLCILAGLITDTWINSAPPAEQDTLAPTNSERDTVSGNP
ncbi:DMT family transporter [Candidatus Formimonas warabiya]|uniref:EamA domain-containing protein n=1 Tax=Formimonas warabiya TaxID=1761012 RepID=A0A3G1KUW8_FORW1|nr:DMT family transporter [Candidatus Formimonas warabiya]ATW26241.1 hypothetical protein DCMF_17060 [Candidatus Formimonas warabiya]